MDKVSPIGVFDSGYGGLTILREIVKRLPDYDYIYLGDNARAPYGSRSYETVYNYTLESVKWLFDQNCPLIILACNTASAKALRTIQQNDLPLFGPNRRVLGVIRPTAEIIGNFTNSGNIAILGTKGTIQSNSYVLEVEKFFPNLHIYQHACPMWVPLIENNEHHSAGAAYFIQKELEQVINAAGDLDAVLLACTHYPLISRQIESFLPEGIKVISQGNIVAKSLEDYLRRHAEINAALSKKKTIRFFTTDDPGDFDRHSLNFFGSSINSSYVQLSSP
ncbi:MAG: glutamate racemase [Ginsengibacter sp.]